MFKIEITRDAIEDLRQFKKHQQERIIDGIEIHLTHHPAQVTRNRKRLRTNALAEWELRIDRFRVFYDVDARERIVKVEAIGCKEGNRLYIGGKEYRL